MLPGQIPLKHIINPQVTEIIREKSSQKFESEADLLVCFSFCTSEEDLLLSL